MSFPDSNDASPVENPFQTPSIEASEVDGPPSPAAPSTTMLAICVSIAYGVKLLTYLSWLDDVDPHDFQDLMWVVYDLASGPVIGLGLAVLTTAIWRGSFKRLMPGHWQLIAGSSLLIVDFGYATMTLLVPAEGESSISWLYWLEESGPYLYCSVLFMLFLQIREKQTWIVYAWIALIYYVVSLIDSSIDVLVISGARDAYLPFPWIAAFRLAGGLLWLVSAVCFLIAVTIDLAQGVRRDAFHYVGLVLPSVVIAWHDMLISFWLPM